MIRIFIVGVFLFGLNLTTAQAQDLKPYLVVKVLDELGEPLSNARVTVLKKGEIVAHGFTDSSGIRIFSALDSGLHAVVVHEGMKTNETQLMLRLGNNKLSLEMGIEQLAPLIVEAEEQLLENSYGGWTSLGGDAVKSSVRHIPRPVFRRRETKVLGGVWLPDSRSPTFQNMINAQPND